MSDSRPQVGAGVVILDGNKTLLARRKGSHGDGTYGSLGGHVEAGETPVETVQREAMEELGVALANIQFLVCSDVKLEGKHYIDITFTAEIAKGEPRIQEKDKFSSVGWYDLNDLPSPLFEPLRLAFEALQTGERYHEYSEDTTS